MIPGFKVITIIAFKDDGRITTADEQDRLYGNLSFSISLDKWLQFSLWDDGTIFEFIGTYTILL